MFRHLSTVRIVTLQQQKFHDTQNTGLCLKGSSLIKIGLQALNTYLNKHNLSCNIK
jgi:hypothetical protein